MRKVVFILLLFSLLPVSADTGFRIASYNVENLFDYIDDPIKDDDAYTPNGTNNWTKSKLKRKCTNLSKAITALGGWKGAAIVGLCEVESELALKYLVRYTPLNKAHYGWIHYESPDNRGVDVALLYDSTQFKPYKSSYIRIDFPKHKNIKTRDVLYVKGRIIGALDIHVFVCHAPSRLGGEDDTEWKRRFVAQKIRSSVDSIFAKDGKANIVIMGDFNDYPDDKSLTLDIKASKYEPANPVKNSSLYNLSYKLHKSGKGSHKQQGEWGMLDQMVVSGALLNRCQNVGFSIFSPDFLLVNDKKYMGKKPFRSFQGPVFIGGYSDHLPIYSDFYLKKEK